MSAETYDGTICMNRKLTDDETHELRIQLIPYFTTDGGMGVDDMSDFLDYIFTMVSNSKGVDYVVKELDGFCSPETSKKIGKELAAHITLFNGTSNDDLQDEKREFNVDQGKRVVSLKSSEEKGNALTLAGALGASREGGRNKKEKEKEKPKPTKEKAEKNESKDQKHDDKKEERNRNDRRDNDRKGGRENRSVQGTAFDRLSKGNDRRDDRGREEDVDRRRADRGGRGRGRGGRDDGFDRTKANNRRDDRGREEDVDRRRSDVGGGGRGRGERDDAFDRTPRKEDRMPRRDDRTPRRDEHGGRGGRGNNGRGPRDMGGRGGRDIGRDGGREGGRFGHGGRGDRMSGQRRPRDEVEEQPDFVPADDRGGRGRATPGRPEAGRGGPKRPRYDEGQEEGYGYDGYEGGYDYHNDGYGFSPYPPFRGGRGGRGRGRGRGPSGRGFEDGREASGQARAAMEGKEKVEEGNDLVDGSAHPSPMVQAAFGSLGFSGRGPFRGGSGRGRGRGGRAHIVSMIQSKTWVRKKDDGTGDDKAGESGDNET